MTSLDQPSKNYVNTEYDEHYKLVSTINERKIQYSKIKSFYISEEQNLMKKMKLLLEQVEKLEDNFSENLQSQHKEQTSFIINQQKEISQIQTEIDQNKEMLYDLRQQLNQMTLFHSKPRKLKADLSSSINDLKEQIQTLHVNDVRTASNYDLKITELESALHSSQRSESIVQRQLKIVQQKLEKEKTEYDVLFTKNEELETQIHDLRIQLQKVKESNECMIKENEQKEKDEWKKRMLEIRSYALQ